MTGTPPLPPLRTVEEVGVRLLALFPEGMGQRNYFVREMAARTVFVLLYAGAVEGSGRWVRPNQVTRMSDLQAARASDAERLAWAAASLHRCGRRPARSRGAGSPTPRASPSATRRCGTHWRRSGRSWSAKD